MLEVKRLSGYNSKGNITKRKQKKNKKRNIIRLINYLTRVENELQNLFYFVLKKNIGEL